MAGRRAGKVKSKTGAAAPAAPQRRRRAKPAPDKPGDESPPGPATAALEARIAALERERDALRLALDKERARRRSLEEVYGAARGRISRALESLQTILNAKT